MGKRTLITKLRKLGMTYKEYLKTDHWREVKRRYYSRNSKECRICGAKHNVHLHHKTYKRLGREYDMDLVPLCKRHHNELHEQSDDMSYLWQKTKNYVRTEKKKQRKPVKLPKGIKMRHGSKYAVKCMNEKGSYKVFVGCFDTLEEALRVQTEKSRIFQEKRMKRIISKEKEEKRRSMALPARAQCAQ